MNQTITFKTKEDALQANYAQAASPATSCSTCQHFQMRWCTMYDFDADPSWTCDEWERRQSAQVGVLAHIPEVERVPIGTMKEVSFTTFKDVQGRWRWVLKSGNAFEDRDGEVVTTKALNRDVLRTDKTGEFGPLRWWHVGNPQWVNPLDWRSVVAGKGLDIGDCDFSAMDGPILIESGTFRSEKLAQAISMKASGLRASLGFSHPLDEPDRDGLFHHIKRFERSLTPANKASNSRTGLVVTKERVMDQDKLARFKELVGDEAADEALADAQSTTKEARGAGIREKGQDENNSAGVDDLAAQLEAMTAQIATFKAAVDKVAPRGATATNVPVEGPPATAPSAIVQKADEELVEDEEVAEEGMGGEEIYVGDMTGPEFVGLLQEALGPYFEQHTKALDLHGKVSSANDAMKEMKQYLGGMAQKDATIAEMREQIGALGVSLKEAIDTLTDMQGDVPKELNRPRGAAYKASEGADNVVPLSSPIYQHEESAQQFQSPLSWIDSFVVQQQQPVQSATVIPGVNGRGV